MEKKTRVALIAHDRKKEDLVKFVMENERFFAEFELIATRMTGMQILKKTALNIQCLDSGARGGDQEMGVLISRGELDAVFFFRDLLTANAYEPDINTLPRLCDIYNIPIATNPKSAIGILAYLKEGIVEEIVSSKIETKVPLMQVTRNSDVNIDHLEETSQVYHNDDVNFDHLEQTTQQIEHHKGPLPKDVLTYIYETQKASALLLQLKFRMTSDRAAGLIKELESQGLVGPMEGNKPREVLMTDEQYQKLIS